MSDIKAGDLVMVVKPQPCCGGLGSVGKVFRVTHVHENFSICDWCGQDLGLQTLLSDDNNFNAGYDNERCKKIPPLSDLEDVETHSKDLIPNKETIGEMA